MGNKPAPGAAHSPAATTAAAVTTAAAAAAATAPAHTQSAPATALFSSRPYAIGTGCCCCSRPYAIGTGNSPSQLQKQHPSAATRRAPLTEQDVHDHST
eukprot:226019-Chlamydomonas_euryale.AAC.5